MQYSQIHYSLVCLVTILIGLYHRCNNKHYATIFTDLQYRQPLYKQTVSPNEYDNEYISEYEMFNILDKLRPTTSGLDQLPAWFLRLGAPVFTATCFSNVAVMGSLDVRLSVRL